MKVLQFSVVLLINIFVSCQMKSLEHSADSEKLEEDIFVLRFSNLPKIDTLGNIIKQRDTANVILLQTDKCIACMESMNNELNSYIKALSNPIIVIVGETESSIQSLNNKYKLNYTTIGLNSNMVSSLGLSILEPYHITFVGGDFYQYKMISR